MDIQAAIGLVAAPGIVAGVMQAFKPIITRYLTTDVLPPLSIVAGVAYCVAIWLAGVLVVPNVAVAVLLGLPVGLSASGLHDAVKHYQRQ